MNNVLWLVSWYPNRVNAFDGDFIERHAIAVSRFVKLTVLLVIKDERLDNKQVEIEKREGPNLAVYRVYYGRSGWGGALEKLLSLKKYLQLQKKIYRQIAQEQGTPSLVHVQVAMKAGILAGWLKRKYKIPYVVTEHWTGYYPESHPNIYNANLLYKRFNKKILNGAAIFSPVSAALGKMINQHFTQVPFQVVPNTVDTRYFYYKPHKSKRFRFIHASYMSFQKNPEGILAACSLVKDKGYDFELLMVGNIVEYLIALAKQCGLQNHVVFEDAVSYPEIAIRMQQSSALVLFSRFENLPCVILEALCCGIPVISSNVGGVAEAVNKDNGILVESENVAALADAMIYLIENYKFYDPAKISANASSMYNYNRIGEQYESLYRTVLESTV